MNRKNFRYLLPLRVRWSEVDLQKIVFNAHYHTYLDTAIQGYWRALALPYEAVMHRLGGDIFLKKTTVEFNASARLDERLDVGMRCERVGNSSMLFHGAVFRGEQALVTGELLYVSPAPPPQPSGPVPGRLRQGLPAFGGAEPMLRVATGGWDALGPDAGALRREVFVQEQGIAERDEWDAQDALALHAVAYNRLDQPVATARLLPPGGAAPGVAHIGRVASLAVLRGGGGGSAVMRALTEAARSRGDRRVNLSAQRSAEAFYRRLGYRVEGEPFDEVGIEHVHMTLALAN